MLSYFCFILLIGFPNPGPAVHILSPLLFLTFSSLNFTYAADLFGTQHRLSMAFRTKVQTPSLGMHGFSWYVPSDQYKLKIFEFPSHTLLLLQEMPPLLSLTWCCLTLRAKFLGNVFQGTLPGHWDWISVCISYTWWWSKLPKAEIASHPSLHVTSAKQEA